MSLSSILGEGSRHQFLKFFGLQIEGRRFSRKVPIVTGRDRCASAPERGRRSFRRDCFGRKNGHKRPIERAIVEVFLFSSQEVRVCDAVKVAGERSVHRPPDRFNASVFCGVRAPSWLLRPRRAGVFTLKGLSRFSLAALDVQPRAEFPPRGKRFALIARRRHLRRLASAPSRFFHFGGTKETSGRTVIRAVHLPVGIFKKIVRLGDGRSRGLFRRKAAKSRALSMSSIWRFVSAMIHKDCGTPASSRSHPRPTGGASLMTVAGVLPEDA